MILLVGDVFLGKVASLLAEFFPEAGVEFVAEGKSGDLEITLHEGDQLVASHGIDPLAGRKVDVVAPRFWVEGLSSIEIIGKQADGIAFLPEVLTQKQRDRLVPFLSQGNVDFHCGERMTASLSKMSGQGPVGQQLASFIDANYRRLVLSCGIDRPTPIATVEAARLIADRLGLDAGRITRKEPWRTDHVAYRAATQVLLPSDAARIGADHLVDSRWLDTLVRILSLVYDTDGNRREDISGPLQELQDQRSRIVAVLSRQSTSPVAKLLQLQKERDESRIIPEIERLFEDWAIMSELQRATVCSAVLRWFPAAGRAGEAVDFVMTKNPSLAPEVAQKIANIVVARLGVEGLRRFLERAQGRKDFSADLLVKATRSLALMEKKSRLTTP